MRVLGVDPGGTTGLAVVDTDRRKIHLSESDPRATVAKLYESVCRSPDFDLIAVERFIITPRTAKITRQPDAMEIIGAIKAFAQVARRPTPVIMQDPGSAKTAWDNERLKVHGIYGPPSMGHARDAMRHALFAIQNRAPDISFDFEVD